MKAQIIRQTCYEGVLAWTHDMGQEVERILVPEMNNLVITPHQESLHVWEKFQMGEDSKIVREIDIPDEFVREAFVFMKSKERLFEAFQAIIAPSGGEGEKEE